LFLLFSRKGTETLDAVAAALAMVLLHRVDGGEVLINPSHVTSLHATAEAVGKQNKLVTGKVRCVMWLADGKFLSVLETCDVVRKKLEEAR
jgi:hypothetical protein